jgi:hypothetical protein
MDKSETNLLYPPLTMALCQIMEDDQALLDELIQAV